MSPARFDANPANPRHRRLAAALMAGPVLREQADRIAGASNAPALVAEFRQRGLGTELVCERIEAIDRDGRRCRPGRYYLTPKGRRMVRDWLRRLRM